MGCFVGLPKALFSPEGVNPVPSVCLSALQPPGHPVALHWTSGYLCPYCIGSSKLEWWLEEDYNFTWSKACIPIINTAQDGVDLPCCQDVLLNYLLFTKIPRSFLAELLPSQSFLSLCRCNTSFLSGVGLCICPCWIPWNEKKMLKTRNKDKAKKNQTPSPHLV